MSDSKLPLIHKAPVEGLGVHVARTRLSIGDPAWLDRLTDGRIGVFFAFLGELCDFALNG